MFALSPEEGNSHRKFDEDLPCFWHAWVDRHFDMLIAIVLSHDELEVTDMVFVIGRCKAYHPGRKLSSWDARKWTQSGGRKSKYSSS